MTQQSLKEHAPSLRWVDTHAHLFKSCFAADEEAVLSRALAQGVHDIYLPNLASNTISAMCTMEKRYPNRCFGAIGLHPCYVDEHFADTLSVIEAHLQRRAFVAIGETGTDFYHSIQHKEAQVRCFTQHCVWARRYDLPLIIHCRESLSTTLSLLEVLGTDRPKTGIFHCFTGDKIAAERVIAMGYYLGVGGVISYKNSQDIRALLTPTMLPHIVLETDSPYLVPSGLSTKRNEPSFLPRIGKQVARCMGLSVAEVARVTTQNARDIFKGKPHAAPTSS